MFWERLNLNDSSSGKFLVTSFFAIVCLLIFGLFAKISVNWQYNLKAALNFKGSLKSPIKNHLKNEIMNNDILKYLSVKVSDLTGKSFEKGVFLKDGTLLKMPKLPGMGSVSRCLDKICDFCDKCPVNVYFLLLPTKFQINGGFVDVNYFSSYEKELMNKIYSKLDLHLVNLNSNVFSSVYSKKLNFFYRTDSSINSFGNYLIYRSILKQMNITPFSFNYFKIENCCSDFYGNLFSEKFNDLVFPDNIELFKPFKAAGIYYFFQTGIFHNDIYSNSVLDSKIHVVQIYSDDFKIKRNSIFDLKQLNSSDKTKVLFGDVAPIKILNNDLCPLDEKLVIFSDGSVDGLMQFLAYHFKQITVVDLNQINFDGGNLNKFFSEFKNSRNDKVLFFYNVETLANFKVFNKLDYFY